MFMHGITSQVCTRLSIPYYSTNNEPHFTPILSSSWKEFIAGHPGFSCFGQIRPGEADPCIPDALDDYRILLHLRDPRDAITSLYYSVTFSHPRKQGGFNPSDEQRKHWEAEGVDKYVLDARHQIRERYLTLLNSLYGRRNVVFTRYEDLVADFGPWLDKFLSVFDHAPGATGKTGLLRRKAKLSQLRIELVKAYASLLLPPTDEDIRHHKRQVTPGDFRRKLRPATVDALTLDFSEILDRLQYRK